MEQFYKIKIVVLVPVKVRCVSEGASDKKMPNVLNFAYFN
jgi:hypothetical protein